MHKLNNRRKLLLLIFVMTFIMMVPKEASAAFSININISRQDDGAACGELWLGDELFWRCLILPDGVRPVLGGFIDSKTTFFTPAVVDGMFVISVK